MGYLDGLTDAAFKKDASGKTLFYPWGIFGSGVIIDSEDKTTQIRGFYKKALMVTFPLVIPSAVGEFWLSLILLPVYGGWYYFTAKKITKNLRQTEEKLKISETYKNLAKVYNLPTLIFLEFTCLGVVAFGVWLLQDGRSSLVAYASMGVFGLCAIPIGYMILEKIKIKNS